MTLGRLIEILEGMEPSKVIENAFGRPHSYRGYYEQLSFEPMRNRTVKDMLKDAKSAVGETYTGWKGGEFTMDTNTDVWFAYEGSTMDEDHSPSEVEFFHMINEPSMSLGDIHLKNLIEAFYSQKPLPGSSVTFKMKMIKSIDYLKSKGYELPKYDKVVKDFEKSKKKN